MESNLHKELKDRAVKYLYDKSHWITRPEVDCGYYGRYDVWGIKSDLITTGIEVKVSKQDFRNNKWKEHRLDFGIKQINWKIGGKEIERIFQEALPPDIIVPANFNYILCPKGLLQPEDMHPKYGLLWFNGERIVNKKKAEFIKMTSERKLRIIMLFLSSSRNKNRL